MSCIQTVTLKHIADNLGVSERLVAYALNGNGRVGEQTRQRIIDEARRVGYRPNRAARTLVTGRSEMLALCLPSMATSYGDVLTRTMEARARSAKYDLLVTRMGALSAGDNDASLLPEGLIRVDGGFLLEPPRMPEPQEMDILRHAVVLGVLPATEEAQIDTVRVNLAPAAQQAVGALLRGKPKCFTFMTTSHVVQAMDETRAQSYVAGVKASGGEPRFIVMDKRGDLIAGAMETFLAYVAHQPCPDAVMCSNDEIAIGVLRAIRTLGLSVPGAVAVTGCDGIDCAQDLYAPLSTIAQPFDAMAESAWELLMQRIADPDGPPVHRTLDAVFVERESTRRA
ncbi:MAG TPA: LacI family DNA-binding transcriptional regulator [Capsulimonadaceae bacterium]|jgi:DNA-binding LacI/PurR family transcriptional regulator